MRFSARHDADVPSDRLFDAVADFDRIERMLQRRGARVQRVDPASGSPMSWIIGFDWRGRARELALAVTRFDRPEAVEMRGLGEAFDLEVQASVVALSRKRSRLLLNASVKPRTMTARLLLQTARLTKPKLDSKFSERVAEYVDSATG